MENPRVIAGRRGDSKKDGERVSITSETRPSSSGHYHDPAGVLERPLKLALKDAFNWHPFFLECIQLQTPLALQINGIASPEKQPSISFSFIE